MAGAPSPERPVVLRRLGIIKDANDAFLQESRAQRDTPQDALELFATEAESSPRLERWLTAVGPSAARSMNFLRRNPIVGVVAVSAVSLVVAVWAINRIVGSDAATPPREATVAATAATTGTPSNDVAATTPTPRRPATTTSRRPAAPVANANTARPAASSGVARSQQVVPSRGESVPVGIARPAVLAPPSGRLDGPAPAAETPAAAPPASEATAAFVDDTIYSEQDREVVPPRTSEILPGPTFARWTTRTNAMEVIVSQTGTVERVRLVTPPQRMPDILILSRAKVWKFAPAVKDGRPVRYRLLMTWEVNP